MSNKRILTPEFRVSFCSVFEPKLAPSGKMKYSICMLFPKDSDMSGIKGLIRDAAVEKWGDKMPENLQNPIKDGNEKDYAGFADHWYINAASDYQPGVVDEKVQKIINPAEFYPGCYARAKVNAFAYDKAGKVGVSIGLQNIQKTRDGDRLDGIISAENDFEPVAGAGGSSSDVSIF